MSRSPGRRPTADGSATAWSHVAGRAPNRSRAGGSTEVHSSADRSASRRSLDAPVGRAARSDQSSGRRPEGGSPRLGMLVVAVGGYVVGWWPGAVAAVVLWGLAPRVAARRRRTKDRRRLGAALADLLELAARGVRTGVAPDRALVGAAEVVGPPAGDLVAELVRWVGAGDARDASRRWALRHHDPAVSIVAATVGLVSGRGGGAARGFEAAANVLRERDRRARDAEAWAAQSRASATLLIGAPVVVALGAFAVDPSRAGRMVAEPVALACVAAGAACELIGTWWMGRLLADVSGARSWARGDWLGGARA